MAVPSLEKQQQDCLNSLQFSQDTARLENIDEAHESTCQWLFEREEYRRWLNPTKTNDQNSFLWIKGKPGAGKSTLMKLAFLESKRTMSNVIVLSFFFNARGDILERSTLGLYRSLLFQLLTSIPVGNRQPFWDVASRKNRQNSVANWTLKELQKILYATLHDLKESNIVWFIDAVDECDEKEARNMVYYLEDLGKSAVRSGTYFKICLASRHYPFITLDGAIELVVEEQFGHQTDIMKYINSKLKAKLSKQSQEIKGIVCERASGVFLWVVLVVPQLNEAFDHGRVEAARKRLDELPDELDDLFENILKKDDKHRDDLILCLQWTLFAKRPLTREEFCIAIWCESSQIIELDPDKHTPRQMERFILSASKGLVEITRSKDHTVQFIHESVRDFFLLRHGMDRIGAGLGERLSGLSHDRLKKCCYRYMTSDLTKACVAEVAADDGKQLLADTNTRFVLLEYAVHGLFYHADAAEGSDISQGSFLKLFQDHEGPDFGTFISTFNAFERYAIRRHNSNVRLLYILAESDLCHLVRLHLKMNTGSNVLAQIGRYGSPVDVAIVKGNETTLRALLQCPLDTSDLLQPEIVLQMERSFRNSLRSEMRHTDAIHLAHNALQRGQLKIFELIFATGMLDLNATFNNHHTILTRAVLDDREDLVRFLLGTGKIDVNASGKGGKSAFVLAIERNHEGILDAIIQHSSFNMNAEIQGRGALSFAAEKGNVAVLQHLIQSDITALDTKDKGGRTALSWAAAGSSVDAVVLLLSMQVLNVNTRDENGRTPLSWAANSGSEDVIELLVELPEIELNCQDNRGLSPLCIAAMNNRPMAVILLLETGKAEVNLPDEKGKTALTWAAERGHENVVDILLGAPKVDVQYRTYLKRRTPLFMASIKGRYEVVKLLLEISQIEVNVQDINKQTPLSAAAIRGHESVVSLLLARSDIDVEKQDVNGQSPLSLAAMRGEEKVVKCLVMTGKADMNSNDKNRRTPLSWAMGPWFPKRTEDRCMIHYIPFSQCHVSVVELLLQENGQIYAFAREKHHWMPASWAKYMGVWASRVPDMDSRSIQRLLEEIDSWHDTTDKFYVGTSVVGTERTTILLAGEYFEYQTYHRQLQELGYGKYKNPSVVILD